MTLSEMFRNIKFFTQDYTDAIMTVATAVDKLGEQLNARMDEMATNLQQALAAVRAEVEDERNVFIGAVKLFQSLSDQVKAQADAAASGADNKEVAQALNDLATQMRENAGPLAQSIVANTPQAVPPMAPSPAVPSGSGDGVSATFFRAILARPPAVALVRAHRALPPPARRRPIRTLLRLTASAVSIRTTPVRYRFPPTVNGTATAKAGRKTAAPSCFRTAHGPSSRPTAAHRQHVGLGNPFPPSVLTGLTNLSGGPCGSPLFVYREAMTKQKRAALGFEFQVKGPDALLVEIKSQERHPATGQKPRATICLTLDDAIRLRNNLDNQLALMEELDRP
jgi:hypothetical protein